MRNPGLTILVLLAALLSACSSGEERTAAPAAAAKPTHTTTGEPIPAAVSEAAKTITGERIRNVIVEIASDTYEGRGPGSLGDAMTRRYLSAQLAELGYEPAGESGWEQRFDLVGITAAQPPNWVFTAGGDEVSLAQNEEFIVGSGVQSEAATIDAAELVFVGYGIEAPEYGWDDFKGADLKGKVLVILNNDPDWDPELFAGKRRLYYGRWTYKFESAARQGAAGAIIIHTTPSAGYPWQVVQSSWTGEQFELPAGDEPRIQVAGWVTEAAAQRLAQLAGKDLAQLVEAAGKRDFEPVPLGVATSISLANALTSVQSANVLGRLPGSDPVLAKEVVVYTAHHDHLGIGQPNPNGDPADRIYNGARDNASGTGMVLNIARAFAALPERPRRTIMIALVGAEEQGLLGSKYLGQEPPLPAGRIAACLNFDSGNLWGRTSDINYVGMGKSSLDSVAKTVAAYQGRSVVPDQHPDKGYFYRSDQFSLARVGVPAFYLRGGSKYTGERAEWASRQSGLYTANDYHQPSDELRDDWDYAGAVEDAQYGFYAGWLIAQADEMPHWNPGDEFEAARLESLRALQ